MYFARYRYPGGLKLEFTTSTDDTESFQETGLYHQKAPGEFESLLDISGMRVSQSDLKELLPYLVRFAETGKLEGDEQSSST